MRTGDEQSVSVVQIEILQLTIVPTAFVEVAIRSGSFVVRLLFARCFSPANSDYSPHRQPPAIKKPAGWSRSVLANGINWRSAELTPSPVD